MDSRYNSIGFTLAKIETRLINKNQFKRVIIPDRLRAEPTGYFAYKDNNNQSWVIGGSVELIQHPDKFIFGLPAVKC